MSREILIPNQGAFFAPDPSHADLATDAEVTAAVAAHAAAGDPHTGYATDGDLTTHAAAADPHAGYRLESVPISGLERKGASLVNTPITAITTATWTATPMGADPVASPTRLEWNPNGYYNAATSNRFTVPTGLGGLHVITMYTEFAANATAQRAQRIDINSGTLINLAANGAGGATAPWRNSASIMLDLVAGDTVDFEVWQNSGGNLNLTELYHSIIRLEPTVY